MKLNFHGADGDSESLVLAVFGNARLVKLLNGRLELRGGSTADHVAAREWISLFMHEAVPQIVPDHRLAA